VSTGHKILLVLHIASVVVAFAPASAHPLLSRQYGEDGPQALQRFSQLAARNGQRVYAPALLLAGLFGLAMVIESDFIDFGQTWVWLAVVVWIALRVIVTGVILPGERKLGAGEASAGKRVELGGMVSTVLFIVMLYLMIWQPGT